MLARILCAYNAGLKVDTSQEILTVVMMSYYKKTHSSLLCVSFLAIHFALSQPHNSLPWVLILKVMQQGPGSALVMHKDWNALIEQSTNCSNETFSRNIKIRIYQHPKMYLYIQCIGLFKRPVVVCRYTCAIENDSISKFQSFTVAQGCIVCLVVWTYWNFCINRCCKTTKGHYYIYMWPTEWKPAIFVHSLNSTLLPLYQFLKSGQ